MIDNPFLSLTRQLNRIETLISELKVSPAQDHNPPPDFKYIPIQEIFKRKICSKPTLYANIKAGKFMLYKFGNKSFVDGEEFLKAFHGVKLGNKNGGAKL